MNPRVLELLKNPKNIQSEDLPLLKEEIHAFPYVQNIRALHLYGVHLYDQLNYQRELSTTAAYTTDKKILYQLINGKIQRKPTSEVKEKKPPKTVENDSRLAYKNKDFPIKRDPSSEQNTEKQEEVHNMPDFPKEIQHLYINGERNRILFEGEENFLDEQASETIDLESTLESGTIVMQKQQPIEALVVEPENDQKEAISDVLAHASEEPVKEFTPETIIDEDTISSEYEVEEVSEDPELSFHETEALTPEVRDNNENNTAETSEEDENVVKNIEEEAVEEVDAQAKNEEAEITIQEEQKIDQDDAELSFHGMEAFMPDVKIQSNTAEEVVASEAPQSSANKHEDEMRRLIEEVEKKMKVAKESASEIKIDEPETSDDEISFAETQNFHFWSTEKEENAKENEAEVKSEVTETVEGPKLSSVEKIEIEALQEEKYVWKPMSLEAHIPDSLMDKSPKVVESKIEELQQEEIAVVHQEKLEESKIEIEPLQQDIIVLDAVEEPVVSENKEAHIAVENAREDQAPVMNVSFFGSDISSLAASTQKEEIKEKEEIVPEKNTVQDPLDSNVPGFINTWQSWLKIERLEEAEEAEEPKVEDKIKVIDAFIENNPKISQLREEGSYVIREKKGDISHLMTETLANLYVEQKLYSKAIKAFEILKKKYPEKAEYFDAKITNVNDNKSGK